MALITFKHNRPPNSNLGQLLEHYVDLNIAPFEKIHGEGTLGTSVALPKGKRDCFDHVMFLRVLRCFKHLAGTAAFAIAMHFHPCQCHIQFQIWQIGSLQENYTYLT